MTSWLLIFICVDLFLNPNFAHLGFRLGGAKRLSVHQSGAFKVCRLGTKANANSYSNHVLLRAREYALANDSASQCQHRGIACVDCSTVQYSQQDPSATVVSVE
jgi:hypothetical protein